MSWKRFGENLLFLAGTFQIHSPSPRMTLCSLSAVAQHYFVPKQMLLTCSTHLCLFFLFLFSLQKLPNYSSGVWVSFPSSFFKLYCKNVFSFSAIYFINHILSVFESNILSFYNHPQQEWLRLKTFSVAKNFLEKNFLYFPQEGLLGWTPYCECSTSNTTLHLS